MSESLVLSQFVRRQTAESRFSHYDGPIEDVVAITKRGSWIPSYREGVWAVNVPPEGFWTGVVELQPGDELVGCYEARQEGEEPRKTIGVRRSGSAKAAAKAVEIIVYSHDTLAETNENSHESANEIIAINAYPTHEIAPMAVNTIMHNHFESSGGTATGWSAVQFEQEMRRSFNYWKNKGMLLP